MDGLFDAHFRSLASEQSRACKSILSFEWVLADTTIQLAGRDAGVTALTALLWRFKSGNEVWKKTDLCQI